EPPRQAQRGAIEADRSRAMPARLERTHVRGLESDIVVGHERADDRDLHADHRPKRLRTSPIATDHKGCGCDDARARCSTTGASRSATAGTSNVASCATQAAAIAVRAPLAATNSSAAVTLATSSGYASAPVRPWTTSSAAEPTVVEATTGRPHAMA